MKNILIIGAGRSTSSLVKYLSENASEQDWKITLADYDIELAEERSEGYGNVATISFDVTKEIDRINHISKADLVISMLPAHMHVPVATDCIALSKHMVTASYVSEEMKALDEEAKKAGVVIMNEIGVDPGIDHLSAMRVIDRIKEDEGKLEGFESFTGGLVAPESDNNPWNYKFTWNPRNVVLAGAGGAVKFIQEGQYKYIPYHKLFRRTEIIEIDDYGKFEGYANRDSLKYREIYNLEDIQTMFRGTFRRPGYCRAWDVFVQLGATDDSYTLDSEDMTFREFINTFLAYNPTDSVELKLMQYLNIRQDDVDIMEKLEWLDIFKDIKIGLKNATPARILQHILERKWKLEEEDKDMIVMWHKFDYKLEGKDREVHSSMVVKGDDSIHTAMANTVGYPVAIASKMILNGTITTPGVKIPISKEIYEPVLNELEKYGIAFKEKQVK